MFRELKKLWQRLQRPPASEASTAPPPASASSAEKPSGDGAPRKTADQRPKSPAPQTRNGIRRLAADDDPAIFFRDRTVPQPPPADPAPAGAPVSDRPSAPEKGACTRTNRHGLPILKGDEDLYRLFSREAGGGPGPKSNGRRRLPGRRKRTTNRKSTAAPPKDKPLASSARRDRNGLPILAADDSLEALFGVQPDSAPPARRRQAVPAAAPFGRLVERSLAERDLQLLLEEKIRQERRGAQKMSIRQQIKAHPLPQEQLDLHGCTALQAEQRTEAFVRGAVHAGLATVRIIVGKGLHSQGRAVLPDVVAEKLSQLKRRGQVLTFRWEKHKKSKSGSLIVFL